MIIPIPVGCDAAVARLPRVTIAIMLLNALVFALVGRGDTRRIERDEARLERLAAWELERAASAQSELAEQLARYPTALAFLAEESGWRELVRDDAKRALLERYAADHAALRLEHPFHRYGLVPAELSLTRLIACMFLHADLLHLGFNMLFLWVVGAVLEERWGEPLFAALYMVIGFAASLAHVALNPRSVEPAIGASGAIAGLMGAFAIQHGRARIRILLVYALGLVPRYKPVAIPAALFLGLWFLEQLFWASLTWDIPVGVAFGAHLGGFAAGALAALLLRQAATGALAERLRAG